MECIVLGRRGKRYDEPRTSLSFPAFKRPINLLWVESELLCTEGSLLYSSVYLSPGKTDFLDSPGPYRAAALVDGKGGTTIPFLPLPSCCPIILIAGDPHGSHSPRNLSQHQKGLLGRAEHGKDVHLC